MGGRIEVDSELGRGSEFRFTANFEPLAEPLESRHMPTLPRFHVLIVDDHATAREVLTELVTSLGWSCETAASGEKALYRIQDKSQEPIDLVLLDWKMPGWSGLETAHRIRSLRPAGDSYPTLVMITAYGREALAEDGKILDGFLTKPATASMLLNAVAEATAGDALRSRVTASETQRLAGLHLLLVEDNPINQQVAQEILQGEGARVEVANHGREAVDRIRETESRYDAVLMDVQMPEMDGYQATREIRGGLGESELPIIAMTANALETDRQLCLDAGMNDHVAKPIDVEEIGRASCRERV